MARATQRAADHRPVATLERVTSALRMLELCAFAQPGTATMETNSLQQSLDDLRARSESLRGYL